MNDADDASFFNVRCAVYTRQSVARDGERSSGRVPLGYTSDPRTKQLVVAPDEARTVRWLFKAAASGKSPSEIALTANARRLPNKSGKTDTWTPRSVLRIPQNPVYVAKRPDGTPAAHRA